MIELAPQHKSGLAVVNPILLAGGTIGYGEAIARGLAVERLGAVVVGPMALASRAGSAPPRVGEAGGGIVLQTGMQNRGIASAVKRFSKLWPRLGCPVVAQVMETRPSAAARAAEQLAGEPGISGIELVLPRESGVETVGAAVRQVIAECDLPLWIKVPLDNAALWAETAAAAGVNGIVVGQALQGVVLREIEGASLPENNPVLVQGELFGPLVFAIMLRSLIEVARLDLPCALIACGGIHSAEQVRQALASGARAVQVDSAVWVEPGLPGWLVDEIGTVDGQ